jgi:flagellar assembly factor FliW
MTAASGPDDKLLQFPDGIPGFPGCRSFLLTDLAEGSAFQLLQSVEEPDVAMIVAVPWTFFPDYAPELSEEDQRELEVSDPDDAVVFCPVTLEGEQDTVYFNLLGPFVVNARTRRGRQIVLDDPDLPLRAPVALGGS